MQGVPVTIGEQAKDIDVKLILRGSGQIQINVKRNEGDAHQELRVFAMPADSLTPTEMIAGSDLCAGHYRIAPLMAGNYRVVVSDGQNPPMAQEVTLAAGESRLLELQIKFAGRVDGRVVDSNDRPIPGVIVFAASESETAMLVGQRPLDSDQLTGTMAVSDANGNFALKGLAEGVPFQVTAKKATGVAVTNSGVVAGDHLSLVIDSPRGLNGIVLDEENQPISQFSVSVFNKELGTGRSATLTGGAGQWQIEGVMPGQIVVVAHDATGRESEMELRLKPGQDIKDLRMVLKSASKAIAESMSR
jgi:hypothetical protein